ncbi:MAG: hypothetical protein MRY21_00075 [Simkaniaceae bacterium]|nr:hypothetical protein [Simkaniaceae bacterium]
MKLEKQLALLRAFLRTLDPNKAQALAALLPQKDLDLMLAGPAYECNPLKTKVKLPDLFASIHPLWWAELLSELSPQDRLLFIAALPDVQHAPLAEHFEISQELPKLTPPARRYIEGELYLLITKGELVVLDVQCGEGHPLHRVLELDHRKFQSFIDHLGLFDMATELKKVIRSSHIKDIEEMLSDSELQLLTSIKDRRDLLQFGEIGMSHWNGELDELRQVLHRRGVNRLAKAFFGADDITKWHLSHRMSPEDCKSFNDFAIETKDKKVYDILIKQMEETLELL